MNRRSETSRSVNVDVNTPVVAEDVVAKRFITRCNNIGQEGRIDKDVVEDCGALLISGESVESMVMRYGID